MTDVADIEDLKEHMLAKTRTEIRSKSRFRKVKSIPV